MTVKELIEELKYYADEVGYNAEVVVDIDKQGKADPVSVGASDKEIVVIV